MSEKNSTNTSTEHDKRLVALGVGLNTLLAVKLNDMINSESAERDEDASVIITAMAHIVRVFEGEDSAKKMIDELTGGAYSKMDDLVSSGVPVDDAAKFVTNEEDDDVN